MTNQEFIAFVKKNPVSIGCGLVSLGLALALFFRSDAIPTAEAELTQKSTEGERHAANIKSSAQLKEQYDALIAATKEIDSRLVHSNQLGTNSQFFYKLESDTGVKMIDFRQSTQNASKPKSGSYIPIAFSVSMQGDLSQLLKVLHTLEGGARYCRILSASISTSGGGGRGLLTLSLSLELLGVP
jgi:hypothetical protein